MLKFKDWWFKKSYNLKTDKKKSLKLSDYKKEVKIWKDNNNLSLLIITKFYKPLFRKKMLIAYS